LSFQCGSKDRGRNLLINSHESGGVAQLVERLLCM
jgi:hypothetical protein